MADNEYSAFSEEGKHFVHYGAEGKLKIWDTESGTLSQEYTPNLHLSSPCTSLTWVTSKIPPSSAKKKRQKSLENGLETEALALGTVTGNVVLYSVASGSVVDQLRGGHNTAVNHVTWRRGCNLFSCDDNHIVEWNVAKRKVKNKWKTGTERLTCLLVLPDGNSILAAGSTIGLWDVSNQKLIRRYTGHATEITSLTLVPTGQNYFISAAKDDRLLNAWSLSSDKKDKNSIASFVMEEAALSVSVCCSSEVTSLVAVTRSGILHLYKHLLNGKCKKPLKPILTVKIASDTSQNDEAVQPTPILGALQLGADIQIAYGSSVFLSFEIISSDCDEKVMFLVRKDPRRSSTSREGDVSKVKRPMTGDVEYISPAVAVVPTSKKGKSLKSEVPMEERLDNLSLSRQDLEQRKPPQADSMAQLLMQGLNSKDKKILQSVLLRKEPKLISSTVMRLTVQSTVPLLTELVARIQGRTVSSQVAVLWLKAVIRSHAGHLLANPDVREILSPVLGLVETRLNLLAPLSRLRGRLDLVVDQIEESSKMGEHSQNLGESLLVYQDQESDEGSYLEDAASGSESEDKWEELSEMDVEEDLEEDEEEDAKEEENAKEEDEQDMSE